MTSPEVSIVIVNWNAGPHLAACLRSLRENPPSRSWCAVVVDNASNDGSVASAQEAAPWATFLLNRTNRGLPAANNQGMVAAAGEYVVIANPDVEFMPGALEGLCDLLDRRPRAGVAVPQLLQADGAKQVSAGDLPRLADIIVPRRKRHGFWWTGWSHDRERRIGHGAEACYAVRRRAIVEVGPQDERYRLDWEGVEWSARMSRGGWETWFTPDATVRHAGGVSVRQAGLRWIAQSHAGMYRYFASTNRAAAPALASVFAARAALKAAAGLAGRGTYDQAHRSARLERR